jgi:isoamylase
VRSTKQKTVVWPGEPYPLGATWDGEGVNFALFSENAEKVELCLFDDSGKNEIERIEIREHTDQIWHCYLPHCRLGQLYGYRVYGPYDPTNGHRFNPNKLLLDPYAKATVGPVDWSYDHFGYKFSAGDEGLTMSETDNAPGMPKCRVVDTAFTWGDDRPPKTAWHDTVIYELHVKGFTQRHPHIPPELRGTYAGLSTAPAIDHLRKLGVTAVELMPVHLFVDDKHLLDRGLKNY